jgi:chromosome segregation ATPase
LRDDVKRVQASHDQCGRLRKSLESERDALVQKVDRLEDELSRNKMDSNNVETMRKRLNATEQSLLDKSNAFTELEADNRTLKQQAEMVIDQNSNGF